MPSDTPNGDGYAYNFDKRLDAMRDVLQTLGDVMLHNHQQIMEQQRGMLDIIRESRGEIRDLLELQREHRIDIMALFMISKETRKRLEELDGKTDPPTDPRG